MSRAGPAAFYFPILVAMSLASCAETTRAPQPASVTLPLRTAWYEGEIVYYVTTDVSEPKIAQKMGANLAPRLNDGLPDYPKPPGQRTVIERVYDFTNSDQNKVFSSAPSPIGPDSHDAHYSPLWLAVLVTWKSGHPAQTLKSEEEVLVAADRGELTLTKTDILLNCPIVGSARGHTLPNVTLDR